MLDFGFASEKEIRLDLAERLRACRLAKGISQPDLALRAGLGRATVQRFEAKGDASLENFIRIVMALGLVDHLQPAFKIEVRSIAEMERAEQNKRKRAPRKPAAARTQKSGKPAP